MEVLPFDEYVQGLNRKRMSAGVLFHDAADRVLLIEPSYKSHWDIPGGAVEADETPWATAVREVHEELGVSWSLGRLLLIDYVPTDNRMPEGLAFVFDGGPITAVQVETLVLTDPEVVSAQLCRLNEARSKVKASLATRLKLAMEAMHSNTMALCDDGEHTER